MPFAAIFLASTIFRFNSRWRLLCAKANLALAGPLNTIERCLHVISSSRVTSPYSDTLSLTLNTQPTVMFFTSVKLYTGSKCHIRSHNWRILIHCVGFRRFTVRTQTAVKTQSSVAHSPHGELLAKSFYYCEFFFPMHLYVQFRLKITEELSKHVFENQNCYHFS